MTAEEQAYITGFQQKCAEYGVDPAEVMKYAQSHPFLGAQAAMDNAGYTAKSMFGAARDGVSSLGRRTASNLKNTGSNLRAATSPGQAVGAVAAGVGTAGNDLNQVSSQTRARMAPLLQRAVPHAQEYASGLGNDVRRMFGGNK
jgi:hypothetical protein